MNTVRAAQEGGPHAVATKEVISMAKNGPKGGGRIGAVKNRTQFENPATGTYTKRNATTGQFMNNKADSNPFKGIRREK
ncbi:hypothetical protein [Egicoccus sp. AB-alg6-2]|uniref:hypothetical protein n=1 Tax=Egicoccus sp. AB-alg6-2 TaxID=3242692 RepID=UPI00359D22DA